MSEFSGVWNDVYRKGLERGLEQGLKLGLDEGEIAGLKKTAINMLRENMYSIETIAKVTKLSTEDIEKIRREISS